MAEVTGSGLALPPASTTRKGVDPSKFMGATAAAGGALEKRVANGEKKITIMKNILKMHSKSLDNIRNAIQDIGSSVDQIADTMGEQKKLDTKIANDNRKANERKKRGLREKTLEAGGKAFNIVAKTAQKAIAPVTNIFKQIGMFLLKFLAATAVMKLIDWFTNAENIGKVKSIFRFLKDWWPTLVAGLVLFAGVVLGPAGIIVGIIALVAVFLPKLINTVKTLFGFGKQADKAVEDADKNTLGEVQKGMDGIEKGVDNIDADKALQQAEKDQTTPPTQVKDASEKGKEAAQLPEQKFAEGGEVKGPGGVDKVPAKLSAGEFVMSKGAVDTWGTDMLAGMNAAGKGSTTIDNSVGSISHNVSNVIPYRGQEYDKPYAKDRGQEYGKPYAKGGSVTGPGGVDKVSVKLTAGEFVMSRDAVKAFGENTFASMNIAGGGTNNPVGNKYFVGGLVKKAKEVAGKGLEIAGNVMDPLGIGEKLVSGVKKVAGMAANVAGSVGGAVADIARPKMTVAEKQLSKAPPPPPTDPNSKVEIDVPPAQGGAGVGGGSDSSGRGLPSFSAAAWGGKPKEHTLGIRR